MIGTCKLTGRRGEFVKAHLLPKALTKGVGLGVPMMEAGMGTRPITRHSSWYDDRLVTRQGEDILAKLDDWAIKELRACKLVWSGWGPITRLGDIKQLGDTGWGVRKLAGSDWKRLRVFFLSLLWRAAASTRPEFADIRVSNSHLEALGRMIVEGEAEPLDFYPVELTQLSTMGEHHNHTSIAQVKKIPWFKGVGGYDVPTFRFYFDGLVAHFDRRPVEDIVRAPLGDLVLGREGTLTISTASYERSFQRQNLEALKATAARGGGGRKCRLRGL